ncbi:MAG TPA: tRNA (adenosine(37)-N6)-dimethylallyltransferase MiaA [Bacteroidales bacterium]|nr:tRNA (adenosine(37)-N6)-dimethylallyltransferase MiaA [Bacteroidales bacterium]
MENTKYNVIVILGPTASGKTAVAANLAYQMKGEIISADSRQIYKKLNLGTGKDYDDYYVNGEPIPFHLIDIADPGMQYNVYEYQKDFIKAYNQLSLKGCVPILCGGSGMYIEAVLEGYQLIQVPVNNELREQLAEKTLEELTSLLKQYKSLHATTDTDNKKRTIRAIEIAQYCKNNAIPELEYPQLSPLIVAIRFDRSIERERITQRLKDRLNAGMLDEVRELLRSGLTPDQLIYYGLEYKFLTQHIIGQITYEEMFTLLNTAIHQFAKRQMTWFRRMEKKGFRIHWIDGNTPLDEKMDIIKSLYFQ